MKPGDRLGPYEVVGLLGGGRPFAGSTSACTMGASLTRDPRPLADVVAIQDEIALAIVENLKVKLLSGERASLVRGRAYNLDEYDTYLRGLFEWNKMTPEGFIRCQEFFREAIRLDPEFAPAEPRLDAIIAASFS